MVRPGAEEMSAGLGAPCGACKFLRRRCVRGCVFAPHFSGGGRGRERGAAQFAAVHRVFGASNVAKLLSRVPVALRRDTARTVCYEAQARIADPVYGCVGTILALQHQAGSTSCISLPGNQPNYKLQLQIFSQKRGKELPLYHRIQDGLPHAPLFKSTVTIDGQTFESPQHCHTIKEAESVAAKLALMSLTQEASSQEKLLIQAMPLLQELAEKEGSPLPDNNATSDDSNYSSIIKSTVDIEGKSLKGEPGNTRKHAEIAAAELAFQHSKYRSHMEQGTKNLSTEQEVKIAEPELSVPQLSMVTSNKKNDSDAMDHDSCSLGSAIPLPVADTTVSLDEHIQSGELENDKPTVQEPSIEVEMMDSTPEGTSSPLASRPPPNTSNPAVTTTTMPATSAGCGCSMLTNRIQVYPRRPDLVLAEGTTVLPFSDDMWVAVSLPFAQP